MTDQKYKLVPVEPTQDMIEWVQAACVEHLSPREAYDIAKTLVAHVPEPVCKWTLHTNCPYDFWGSECGSELGHGFERIDDGPDDWNFCPHCGKKVVKDG